MSLKYKVSLLISLLFVVTGAASVLVNRFLIMPSFIELERQQAHRNVERAVEAINRDLEVLSTNVTAWAWWDESRSYVRGENPAFVERELSAEPVASAEVSYMGFYRTNGAQLIHRAPAAENEGSPSLGVLQEPSLPADHPLLQHADIRGDTRGLVKTPLGPMLVASRPILTSSGEGPAAGVLVFGRLFDAATIKRIAGQYKLDVTFTPVSAARPLAADWQRGSPPRTAVTLVQSETILTGESTLADVHGNPILTLRVMTPRSISARGEQASLVALATLCTVALMVLGVLLALIHVTVLRPIMKLTAHAVDVGKNDALHKRLKLERRDELGALAAEFDRMTDRLVEARRHLIDQSFVSGRADMAAGILHNLGNAVTPITVRLHTLSERMQAAPVDYLEKAVAELETSSVSPERRADLVRFVQLAGRDLARLIRDTREDIRGIGVQVEHIQQILREQERFSHASRVVDGVDMEQVIRQAADGLSPQLQSAARLEVDPSVASIGTVRGPRVEIQQIVGNLLLNAAESIVSHGESQGRIVVRALRDQTDGCTFAHLVFEDNGAGIRADHLAHMFNRRFSTKERGSGVGLHWSANAVVALGGRLYAESAGVGHGAQLHLILPLAKDHDELRLPLAAGAQ